MHFVLEESWVLDIAANPGLITIKVDLVYSRDHPEVRRPRPGEFLYSRIGVIRLTGVTSLSWSMQGLQPARNLDGSTDWGSIDSMTVQDHTYALSGDFGDLVVHAAAIELAMTGPA